MNSALASRAVRRWVRLYSHGLAADARTSRCDEIESDLWSQRQEAEGSGKPDGALGNEILARMVFGMTADIAWRLDQENPAGPAIDRSATMATRITAVLAVLGALGLLGVTAAWALAIGENPTGYMAKLHGGAVMSAVAILAIIGLILSVGGFGYLLLERYGSGVGALALGGAAGSVLGLIGAYAAIVLLPVASVAVAAYLARIHAIHWSLALVHAVGWPGFALGLAVYYDTSLAGVTAAFVLIYSVSWMAIGVSVFGGLPTPRPVRPKAG